MAAGCIAKKILTRNRVFGGFVASKVAGMVTLQHKRRLGQNLVKIRVHTMRALKNSTDFHASTPTI